MKQAKGLELRAVYQGNGNNNSNANGNNNLNNNARLLRITQTLTGQPHTSLWQTLTSYQNLELAYRKARKRKTTKDYILEFESDLKQNLLTLQEELITQTYTPSALTTFVIRDPKTRVISKSSFKDRIVHHAICNVIEPLIEPRFIHDSYANRIGKGTLNAIKRFDTFKHKASKNFQRTCYVLKADIKSYFDTVDHNVLLRILNEYIYIRRENNKLLKLIKLILDNHKGKTTGKGMPLGNLTSQFFANVYLNELDQYIKHTLKAKYYIRYVDDFVILSDKPKELAEYKEQIDKFLKEQLQLQLHPTKTKIFKLEQGVPFLGVRIFTHHKLLNKKNVRRFHKRLTQRSKDYHNKQLPRETAVDQFQGWLAYATHANTYKLRRNTTKQFNKLFPIEITKKTINPKKHENIQQQIETSNSEYTVQITKQLFNQGLSIEQIARKREVQTNTIYKHLANLVAHNQLPLKKLVAPWKVKLILKKIKTHNDSLKEIKNRTNNKKITYEDINLVLANQKGKHEPKSLTYYLSWYQKTNCYRKCYPHPKQRELCKTNMQLLQTNTNLTFTKQTFLEFIHNHTNICILPEKQKHQTLSYKELKKRITFSEFKQ